MQPGEVHRGVLGLVGGEAGGLIAGGGGGEVLEQEGEAGVVVGGGRGPAVRRAHGEGVGDLGVEAELVAVALGDDAARLAGSGGHLGDDRGGRAGGGRRLRVGPLERHPVAGAHLAGADPLGGGAHDRRGEAGGGERGGEPLGRELLGRVAGRQVRGVGHGVPLGGVRRQEGRASPASEWSHGWNEVPGGPTLEPWPPGHRRTDLLADEASFRGGTRHG